MGSVKNLFNFKFSWPHIPLPHFSVSGSANPLDWLKNGPPKLNVSWFAKSGILTKPTVFGMNGNTLMAGGDAGNEAVIPLNEKTLGMIGQGIVDAFGTTGNGDVSSIELNKLIHSIEKLVNRPVQVSIEIDKNQLARALVSPISRELAWESNRAAATMGYRRGMS